MSVAWQLSDALSAWLHDPPDKALDIRGHESRARRYVALALGREVTESEQKLLADSLASATERFSMPRGDEAERRVEPADGFKIVHPLSAQPAPPLADGSAVNEELVTTALADIAAPFSDVERRFLALWRFLPERLAKDRPDFDLLPADTRTPDHTIWQHMDATAALAAGEWGGNAAFLSFSLGPVQSFIAAARSLRDLWSGSMILSWLTFQAMLPVIERLGPTALVYPAVRGLPLLDQWLDGRLQLKQNLPAIFRDEPESRRSPCLPNRFLAVVPSGPECGHARDLADLCQQTARGAWNKLCEAVRQMLDNKWTRLDPGWHARWHEQVENYFEVRTAVLPWKECDDSTLAELLRGTREFQEAFPDAGHVRALGKTAGYNFQSAGQWQYRLELSARLMEAARSVRHAPPATKAEPIQHVPPKCSLLGSFEQIGPAELAASANFWQEAAKTSFDGVRLRANERFCAVALVKRFAGPAFFKKELRIERDDLRLEDTATVAAAEWLKSAGIESAKMRAEHGRWSGQWLHWPRPDFGNSDGEVACPQEVWEKIESTRRDPRVGRAPAYYAILMLDGDNLGGWLRGELSPRVEQIMHSKMVNWYRAQAETQPAQREVIEHELAARRPVGPALHASISTALSNFALHFVPDIVDKCGGELIYAGGDDVLALLPAATALACARKLSDTFRENWKADKHGRRRLLMGDRATLSAGLAVVHYKEDLRFALQAARQAEKAAKSAGRDALQIVVCRRSGEHASALCPWSFTVTVEGWVNAFLSRDGQPGASDRWLYHLRQELETLQGLPHAAMRAELRRQLGRADEATRQRLAPEELANAFDTYRRAQRPDCPDGQPRGSRFKGDADTLTQFITLCQSASFLARGRDE